MALIQSTDIVKVKTAVYEIRLLEDTSINPTTRMFMFNAVWNSDISHNTGTQLIKLEWGPTQRLIYRVHYRVITDLDTLYEYVSNTPIPLSTIQCLFPTLNINI